jgi:membrane protease YdiL (CAAX protease family)
MTGEATSPRLARWIPAEWGLFAGFVRHPLLPGRVAGVRPAALGATLRLFALDAILMAILLALVSLATALGFKVPENALDGLKLTPLILALVVVILPIGEEIAFRCWLSGRAGHVLASLVFIACLAIVVISGPQAHPVLVMGALLVAAVAGLAAVFWLRHRPAMGFFARHFAWFYFAGALAFALAHLTNYSAGAGPVLLLLVVPQLLIGLILGYARVTYGLWSDMLLHMMHNGTLIGLVVLQKGIVG